MAIPLRYNPGQPDPILVALLADQIMSDQVLRDAVKYREDLIAMLLDEIEWLTRAQGRRQKRRAV